MIQIKPSLKLPQIIALYIGAVLGSGILIIPGIAAEISGPASLIAWGLMIILVMPMALTMGLLSAKFPDSGGVSYFVTKAFNSHWGSLVGWYFLMSVVIGAPVLALTGAGYLSTAIGLNDNYRLLIAIVILLAGLLTNYFGMKVTGQLQIVVVLVTITILVVTIIGSFSKIDPTNFKPFISNGWASIGFTLPILFWCFIGWEAVANISKEFQNPRRDAIRGTIIGAIVVSIIYFFTALVIVGTHSYGLKMSEASLIYVIKNSFGTYGSIIAGFGALFICIAPAIAYIGAASRLAFSLAENGYAPKSFSRTSRKYNTPSGGLLFLAMCFTVLLIVFSSRIISLAVLIQIPNATFILTYLGGCAAGLILLKDSKRGFALSVTSLILSAFVFLFVKWTILYPVCITLFWFAFMLLSGRFKITRGFRGKKKP
jgi:amino acid efflux transporter